MNSEALTREGLATLCALTKTELRDGVIKLYFTGKGWKVERVDARSSLDLSCDLLLSRVLPGEKEFLGVDLEVRRNIETQMDAEEFILRSALQALRYCPSEGSGYLARYYWITTALIAPSEHAAIRELVNGHDATRGRVSVWDAAMLFEHLSDSNILAAIEPLRVVNVQAASGDDEFILGDQIEDQTSAEKRASVIAVTPLGEDLSAASSTIFVSYSRENKEWLDRIKKMLALQIRRGALDFWDDSRIPPGAPWEEAIEKALAVAKVAVLLVSESFLASPFVMDKELPFLLKAARDRKVKLLWALIDPCKWEDAGVGAYQALHDPAKSLSELRGPQQKAQLKELCNKIERMAKETIPLLQVNHAEMQSQRFSGIFAAHWAYRAFRLHLLQPSPDLEKVSACLSRGLACIAEDPLRQLYYYRILQRVFEAWRSWLSLISDRPDLIPPGKRKLELMLDQPQVKEFFATSSSFGIDTVTMLQDFELTFRQLVTLEERYVDAPAGLSTLVICRLLLRFGFFPSETGKIQARYKRMVKELAGDRECRGASIDDQCSLCTGVLLSCFSLARRHNEVQKVKDWLLGLKEYRFSHRLRTDGRRPRENALHYASQTLLGLLDFDLHSDELLAPILDEFFQPEGLLPRQELWRSFYLNWIQYSNIDRFETYRFILSTFLRFFLSGRDLPPQRTERLRQAVQALATDMREEIPEGEEVYLFYPARTNLPSLVLGLWLKMTELTDLVLKIVQLHHRRASTAGRRDDDQLWDSNVDRTVNFIEGLLDYWETMIALEERDGEEGVKNLLPSRAVG
jgi:TIR domain